MPSLRNIGTPSFFSSEFLPRTYIADFIFREAEETLMNHDEMRFRLFLTVAPANQEESFLTT